jgi:hypothetical protein
MAGLDDAYSALQAADAAGDTDSAKQLAEYIKNQTPSTATPDQSAGRQLALGGRAVAQGVVGALTLPNTIMSGARNLPAYVANKFFGGHYPYASSDASALNQGLTTAGAPTPQTAGENLAGAGISGLSGGVAGGSLLGAWPTVANLLRSGSAGASGGLSQEGARQIGLPTWMQIGAGLLGSQTPAMGESTVRTLGDLLAPLTKAGQSRALGTLFNQEANNPTQALANLQASAPTVPGSLPTSGAASGDVGLLGIEKYARGTSPTQFGQRISEQNAARQAELSDIAGTPQDLKAAISARSSASSPLYSAAAEQSAPIDNEMIALMQRPSMQAAIAKAKQLAEERGETFGMSANAPGSAMSLSGRDLQGIKMALDDMKSTGFTQGIGSHQQAAMQDTLDALKGWMQKNVPAQRAADASFQNLSTPINRMTTLQELQQRAQTTAGDPTTGQYFLSPAGFNRGLMAAREEPFSGISGADNARLDALLKDLEGSQAVNGPLLKAPGSDTFQNLSLRQNLGGLARFAGKPLETLYNLAGSDKSINALLTQAMLDPKVAAALMQRAQIPRAGLNFRPFDLGTVGGLLGSSP